MTELTVHPNPCFARPHGTVAAIMFTRLLLVALLGSPALCVSQSAKPFSPSQDPPPAVSAHPDPAAWWQDSNWWLVIVATGTAFVIGWQSFETRKAAEAGRKAAEAALVSAESTVNLERPWLVLRAESYGYQRFKFIAENRGRSPAEIVGFANEWVVVDDVLKWFDSGVPIYQMRKVSPPHLLFAGEGGFQCGACNVGDIISDRQDVRKITSGECLFVMYGKVVYYDVLNRTEPPHESRFCFTWDSTSKSGDGSVDGSDNPAAFFGYS